MQMQMLYEFLISLDKVWCTTATFVTYINEFPARIFEDVVLDHVTKLSVCLFQIFVLHIQTARIPGCAFDVVCLVQDHNGIVEIDVHGLSDALKRRRCQYNGRHYHTKLLNLW